MPMFEVTAVKDRWIHGVNGKFRADEGYVVHRSFLRAGSAEDAIEQVKDFHILPGVKYDHIRAEPRD